MMCKWHHPKISEGVELEQGGKDLFQLGVDVFSQPDHSTGEYEDKISYE
jgi:hypothetical protein